VGNDMSSRDIEGENPLWSAAGKVTTNAAPGPYVLVMRRAPCLCETEIRVRMREGGVEDANPGGDEAQPEELVHYLYREASFK
jgi:hypothetical protein